ncbi:MAG: SIR2 family protein [candidate division Zixibacteria bacterium]|nr:SIR2 family protein [Candidatus Tariuqbacter arcticus]
MSDNILYVLGAGFSAPLGIPVIKNFYNKSNTLYLSNNNKLPYFNEVKNIETEVGKVSTFMNFDLRNIEELLSIIEMKSYLTDTDSEKVLQEYIKEVIDCYTPKPKEFNIKNLKTQLGNYYSNNPHFFTGHPVLSQYASFILALFVVTIKIIDNNLEINSGFDDHPKYSIITLNYDMVFENILNYFNNQVFKQNIFALNRKLDDNNNNSKKKYCLSYAKIHGSLDSIIIPMTWNKTSNEEIKEQYKFAYQLISDAKEIRFIGYSLPVADNHLKYLFINGIMKTQNLQKIDVICLDDKEETVKKRYKKLFHFRELRFKNSKVEDYLNYLCSYNNNTITYNLLEDRHEKIMK